MTKKKKDLVAKRQESEKPQAKEEYRGLLDDSGSESDIIWQKPTHRIKKFQKNLMSNF
ncbi:hypothetical protein [Spiroplasma endosymbiont of Dilophus febrilis]|uniref:hypothetical protein n=1 Tax=Spiroplasma endosymbiont of Dilophus febrilis TaxID=3066292 RepID=UPI00313BC862